MPPENAPFNNQGRSGKNKNQNKESIIGEWRHDFICHHKQVVDEKSKANILKFPTNKIPSIIQIFEHIFPKKIIKEVII